VKAIWLAGASGLVGRAVLDRLLADDAFETVVAVGRRTLPVERLKLRQRVVDFADPATFAGLEAPEVALSCLGTTIRRAGSREAFRAVDHDAVVAFARAARDGGARAFVHVTSLGADSGSSVFYNAVKGDVEKAVAALGFTRVTALRPSLLDGDREESRPGERVSLAVGRVLGPLLGKYRPTPVDAVAAAMIDAAKHGEEGVHTMEAPEIGRFAKKR
jgi:uncharacterized protein YbjT (DUF2867 family)